MGAHGWVAGIAGHGSVLLSRGWLITVEAPGHPRHPTSTQLDAVVNVCLVRHIEFVSYFSSLSAQKSHRTN